MTETTQDQYSTLPTLYLAFELSNAKWKLGFTVGLAQRPRERTIDAGDLEALEEEIRLAKKRFGLPETARVKSCYEAGRDGFWLHRYLEANGIENVVVDSSSIEVNRRKRRAKTDRLDVGKLLRMLMRYEWGEKKVWSVVHAPGIADEDKRHLHRQLLTLKKDRTRHINRIKGLLTGQGVRMGVRGDFLERLEGVRLWDGTPLPAGLRARVGREYAGLEFIEEQIRELEAERRELLRSSGDGSVEKVRRLLRLRGIGVNSAWLYVMEFFGWRGFRNRRQVSGLSGLTPTPHQSGDESRERGISKAGNRPVRAMAIEIAWGWLRHQPESELSRWYEERFGQGSKRVRKIGIVALARKLLVALWRYVEYGEITRRSTTEGVEQAKRGRRDPTRASEAPVWCERAVTRPGFREGPPVRGSRSPGELLLLGEHSIGCLVNEASTDRRSFRANHARRPISRQRLRCLRLAREWERRLSHMYSVSGERPGRVGSASAPITRSLTKATS